MTFQHRVLVGSLATLAAFALGAGCNQILGNEEGTPAPTLEGGVDASSGADGSSEAGSLDATVADADFDAALSCPPDKKACEGFRACVDPTDPNFGCGNTICVACNSDNATSVSCVGSTKGIVCEPKCKPGFADCDAKPINGCEVDISTQKHCGSCTVDCGTSLCAAGGSSGYQCVAACPLGQTECGSQCVDTATSPQHCGTCSNACGTSANATATCQNSKCGQVCNALYHACNSAPNACFADSDVQHCGAGTCADCTANQPANTVPSCQSGACAYQCAAGYGDCDGSMKNGCETDLFADPNCGACGKSCSGTAVPNSSLTGTSLQCCNGSCILSSQICKSVR